MDFRFGSRGGSCYFEGDAGHRPHHAQRKVHPRRVRAALSVRQPWRTATARRHRGVRHQPAPLDITEALLARKPKILGFGIYIWNVEETTEVITAIKRIRPEIKIILGGPEVSYETEGQRIVELADHVITGEADLKFAEVCRVLLNQLVGDEVTSLNSNADCGVRSAESNNETPHVVSNPKIIAAELPEFSRLALPYAFYTDRKSVV